ncbi:MAG: folate-binding protein YgfZ [Betaproteobacteria bacterium]|nr:folate-binding protein YgfZ [Betaproteobacteria bacterium]
MHPEWRKFLTARGAAFGPAESGSHVEHFGHPAAEIAALGTRAVLCDLSQQSLILASGDDARAFLHGQLTNDVEKLMEDHAQWNGYCTPKGRLIASFLLWPAKQGVMLQLPREQVDATVKRLRMFVLRSKVKLDDVSDQWVSIGVAGPGAAAALAQCVERIPAGGMLSAHQHGLRILRLESERFVLVGAPDVVAPLWDELAAPCMPCGINAWDWHAIAAGIPEVRAATRESFVPQMINFDLMGGVSFRKGCFPGQEIVARTQYRGILKRRMMKAVIADALALPTPGDAVYSPAFGDQAAGEIVLAARAPLGHHVLVVAQTEALRQGALTLKAPDGPALGIESLPYPVTFPDAA